MKNFTKKISVLLLALVLFLPQLSLAVHEVGHGTGGPIPPNTTVIVRITNPFNCGGVANCTLIDLITAILNNIVMPIAVVGVIMWILWAGFGFLTAQGNDAKLTIAKQRLLWSLIGAGILLGAAGISTVVQNTVRALMTP